MKLKLVIVDFECSPRARRVALRIGLAALFLGFATLAYADVPNVFKSGEVLTAAALNADFALHDTEIAAIQADVKASQSALSTVQSSALTTVFPSSLNSTDPMTDTWQPYGTTCNQAVHTAGATAGSAALPQACTIGANRRCLALGYKLGVYIGEDPGNDTTSILCIK